MTEDTKRKQIIEAIFDALPATTLEEITSKVNRAMRLRLTIGDIGSAMAYLRKHPAQYDYTVPHVQRGKATEANENRYFAVLVNRDGEWQLDSNPEYMIHMRYGAIGSARYGMTLFANGATAWRIAANQTRKPSLRSKINDHADDMAYQARKSAALLRELEDEADAA